MKIGETLDLERDDQIVITGRGLVSPLGNDVTEAMDNIFAGRDAIALINGDFSERYPQLRVHVSAPVPDFDINNHRIHNFSPSKLKRIHPSAQYSLWAISSALIEANLIGESQLERGSPKHIEHHGQVDPRRIAICMGTGIGGAERVGSMQQRIDPIDEGGNGKRLEGTAVLTILPERVATVPAKELGIRGPAKEVTGACATANLAMIAGAHLLKLGEADVVVVGGSEAQLTPVGLALFEAPEALDDSTDPRLASRPFDGAAKGFVMGEGAGALVMETYRHAKNRGAPIIARLVGYGETNDADHDTAPNGIGAAEALHKAICSANGIEPAEALRRAIGSVSLDEIIYINAHGTGTPLGDPVEIGALNSVLKNRELSAYLTSTKGASGHLLGAAGAFEAIVCISALERGEVPPSLKLDNPIPETEGWLMSPDKATLVPELKNGVAISDSFGFGGVNAVIALMR